MGSVGFYELVKKPLRGPDHQLTSNLEPDNWRGSLPPPPTPILGRCSGPTFPTLRATLRLQPWGSDVLLRPFEPHWGLFIYKLKILVCGCRDLLILQPPRHTSYVSSLCLKQTNKQTTKTQAPKWCHLDQVPKLGLDTSSNCGFKVPPRRGVLRDQSGIFPSAPMSLPLGPSPSPKDEVFCKVFRRLAHNQLLPPRESHTAGNNPFLLLVTFCPALLL